MLQERYDPLLVVCSFVLAMLASYTALSMVNRVTKPDGRLRASWLLGATFAQGMGIWGMHFTGMLAFHLPVPIEYDVVLVIVSIVVACVGALLALLLASRRVLSAFKLIGGGLSIGGGIAGLHYIDMAAMRMAARVDYDPALVGLSILIACGCGLAGLWLARRYPIDDPSHPAWGQAMAAAILGTAIAGQHYTAMSAARFYPAPPHAIDPWRPTFAVTALPAIVLIAMLAILVIALVSATVDRRARDRVSLSQRLLGAQEAERRRISGVLHEDLGGLLTALRLNLQRYTSAPPPAPVATDNLELVDEALERVRAIALELRPAVLDDLGLGPAVAGYARRQAERAGYNLTIEDTLDSMRLPEEMETVSFRILQQALTNIARHAEASNVHVVLLRTVDRFELSVTDDGVGFDVATARARAVAGESLGLLDMNELATLAGGQLSISSYPGRGSTVNAYFYMGSR